MTSFLVIYLQPAAYFASLVSYYEFCHLSCWFVLIICGDLNVPVLVFIAVMMGLNIKFIYFVYSNFTIPSNNVCFHFSLYTGKKFIITLTKQLLLSQYTYFEQ